MRTIRIIAVGVVLAGIVVLALNAVPALQAQRGRPVPVEPGRPWLLEDPGSYIGASVRDVEPVERDRDKGQSGALIEAVEPDAPAARAGFQAADVVIEFDGERVRSARQFSRLVRETPPGRTVRAVVMRGGRRTDLSVTPTTHPRPPAFFDGGRLRRDIERLVERMPPVDLGRFDRRGFGAPRLGVSVGELSPQLASYFGVKSGLLVESVVEDSPAARAGLRAGDVITTVAGTEIRSRPDLSRALRGRSGDVTVGIVRDRKESSVTIVLPSAPQRPVTPVRADGIIELG
jgi:S1-C subfamily serine protease